MRTRLAIAKWVAALTAVAISLALGLSAQQPPVGDPNAKGPKGKARGPAGPAPRLASGKVSFGPGPGQKGVWQGPVVGLTSATRPDPLTPPTTAPVALALEDVPFQPWAKGVYDYRRSNQTADDPHVRCKPSAGARLYHTPYGWEIIQVEDMQRIFLTGVGGAHTYRTVYMDGRPHPSDFAPAYHGHSIGRWEGNDKLIVDTVGLNTRFWFARDGYPHTEQLHIIESFERPDYNTLHYRITIDDPGAYTAPWSSGWVIPWGAGNEMYEFVCQENNRDARHMYAKGDQ